MDLGGCMPPAGLGQYPVIQGLGPQFDGFHPMILETVQDGGSNGIRPGGQPEGAEKSPGPPGFRQIQQSLLDGIRERRKRSPVKSQFIGRGGPDPGGQFLHLPPGPGQAPLPFTADGPLVAEGTLVGAPGVGDENGKDHGIGLLSNYGFYSHLFLLYQMVQLSCAGQRNFYYFIDKPIASE